MSAFYVVVFSFSTKRFQTLNSKNVKWKVRRDASSHNYFTHPTPPPPSCRRKTYLSQQKFDRKSFQTNGSLIIINNYIYYQK